MTLLSLALTGLPNYLLRTLPPSSPVFSTTHAMVDAAAHRGPRVTGETILFSASLNPKPQT